MGITVEFYAVELHFFDEVLKSGDGDRIVEALEKCTVVDFSFHIEIPYDLDGLCAQLKAQGAKVSPFIRDTLVGQLFDGGPTESLALIADDFPIAIAELGTRRVEKVAEDWARTFPYQELPEQTPAYKAVIELYELAQEVVREHKKLVLYLLG